MFKYGITNGNALPTICRASEILQHFKYITKLYVDCDSLQPHNNQCCQNKQLLPTGVELYITCICFENI